MLGEEPQFVEFLGLIELVKQEFRSNKFVPPGLIIYVALSPMSDSGI